MNEHPPQTPQELFDAYEAAAAMLPWPWRWWFSRKARKARRAFEEQRDTALQRALKDDPNFGADK